MIVIVKNLNQITARVEVFSEKKIIGVNSDENKIHRKAPASFSNECSESGEFGGEHLYVLLLLAVNFSSPHSPGSG